MIRKVVILIIVLFNGFVSTSIAQSKINEQNIENKTLALLAQIDNIADNINNNYTPLIRANQKLMTYLYATLSKYPETITMPFTKLSHKMNIISSDDNKMRIYTWPTQINNSVYDVLVQFKTVHNSDLWKWNNISGKLEDIDLDTQIPTSVYNIHTINNKNFYLIISYTRIGQSTYTEYVTTYEIKKKQLNAIPFFSTAKKTMSTISCEYDPTYKTNYKINSRIHLSKDKRKLYIPIINKETLTKNFLVYQFDGNKFVYTKRANSDQ